MMALHLMSVKLEAKSIANEVSGNGRIIEHIILRVSEDG